MQRYIGTKIVKAKPMNRLEYNQLRGWELPADENGSDEGMLVEYMDGGKANHPDFSGYISWSPKDVFERSYHLFREDTWLERLETERNELNTKVTLLTKALDEHKVPELQRGILTIQLDFMKGYLDILDTRLKVAKA